MSLSRPTLGADAAVGSTAVADAGPSAQFITFTIDDGEYGVDIMAVREIRGWTGITAVPKLPEHVRGVINLRGTIVPVHDLRARFGHGAAQPTKTHVVIVVAVAGRVVGLLVDGVSDILTVERTAIRPIPEMDRNTDDAFLAGIVAIDDRMVTVIALENLFRPDAMAAPSPASSAGAGTRK